MPDGSNRPSYGPHPDAVLLRQRRMQRAQTVVKLALAMVTPLTGREPQEPGQPRRKGGNPNPNTRAKPKTCKCCGKTYPQSKGYFGCVKAQKCIKCNNRRRERIAFIKAWEAERKARNENRL